VALWEAAKASASAPTYFPAHVTSVLGAMSAMIDGGVVANNPVACAIAEAIRIGRDAGAKTRLDEMVVGSFGTGESARPIAASEAREWGALEWAVPIISVLMDGAADSADYIARQLLGHERYVRLDTRLDTGFDDLDDASETNVEALLNLAMDYVRNREGGREIRRLAGLLG
jgi:patatin-like phospholipase/acyl hydrolase